jgi:hypothetical protein
MNKISNKAPFLLNTDRWTRFLVTISPYFLYNVFPISKSFVSGEDDNLTFSVVTQRRVSYRRDTLESGC